MSGYGRRAAAAEAASRIAKPNKAAPSRKRNAPEQKEREQKAPDADRERDILAGLAMIAAQQPAERKEREGKEQKGPEPFSSVPSRLNYPKRREQKEPAPEQKEPAPEPNADVLPDLNVVVNPASHYIEVSKDYMFAKLRPVLMGQTPMPPVTNEFHTLLRDAIQNAYGRFSSPLRFDLPKKIEYRLMEVERKLLANDNDRNNPGFAVLSNAANPFKIVNDELDLVRQKKTNQFLVRVGVVPPVLPNAPQIIMSLLFKWSVIHKINPNIVVLIRAYLDAQNEREEDHPMRDEGEEDFDNRDDADQARDEEKKADPDLNQEDVNENLEQLGHITAKLWAPTNRQKEYFDDERDKYCNVAAKILAHCRWSSPGMPREYRRPTADTLYTALDILKEANIITKKKYVGVRGKNIRYLEDNVDRADAPGEKDARMEGLPMRARRAYNRFEDELRYKRAKMRANLDVRHRDF